VPSIFRLQTSMPDALGVQIEAVRVILGGASGLRSEQRIWVQLAASVANEDAYQASLCDAILSRLTAPPDADCLTQAERTLMHSIAKLVDSHQEWSVTDVQALRHFGFSEAQILEAVAAAALANFFNVLRLGLGVVQETTLPARLRSLQSQIAP